MKKSLIAAAVAAGIATPMMASADVSVYGIAYVGITQQTTDNGTSTTAITQDDNEGTGRIGFKFDEELGGGMSSFGVFEYQMDVNDTVAAGGCGRNLCDRQQFAGLKASWGSLAAGRFHSTYKTTGGVKFDPFVATDLQARGNGGMAKGALAQNSFVSQLIQYKSPKMSGFQLQYQTSINDANTDLSQGERNTSWGITYTGVKGLTVIAASSTNAGGADAGVEDASNTKFGAKYEINKEMFVTLQSESTDSGSVDAGQAGDYTYLNFGYKAGSTLVVIASGSRSGDGSTSGDSSYLALGAITSLSKQTQLIYGYRATSNDNVAGTSTTDITALTVGLKKKF